MIAVALTALASACAQQDQGDDTADVGEGARGGEATTIETKLQEWSVVPDESTASAGKVSFDVSNVGEREHEFKVVSTELDLAALPTKQDGSFDEEAEDVEIIEAEGEPEGPKLIGADDARQLDYTLEEGDYVLMCNLVDAAEGGEEEAHFARGMRIPFSVS